MLIETKAWVHGVSTGRPGCHASFIAEASSEVRLEGGRHMHLKDHMLGLGGGVQYGQIYELETKNVHSTFFRTLPSCRSISAFASDAFASVVGPKCNPPSLVPSSSTFKAQPETSIGVEHDPRTFEPFKVHLSSSRVSVVYRVCS